VATATFPAGNTARIDASGQAGVPVTANGTPGSYNLTAGTSGAVPVAFSLTNHVGFDDAGFERVRVGTGSSGYQYRPAGSPWTFTGSAGVAANGSAFTASDPNAPEGNQVAFLQGTGSISQAVYFTGGIYTIGFKVAQAANVLSNAQGFQVLVDGVVVASATPWDLAYTAYTTASFRVTAGKHTVTFAGLGADSGAVILLDQLSINLVRPGR
jgi:hypothetical protein